MEGLEKLRSLSARLIKKICFNLNGVLTHLFEKGKNAPPIFKPCLLVISRKRNKAFEGPKNPKKKVVWWVGAEIGGKKEKEVERKF
jgi:hypothetical protein